jgi:hypothetical protein
MIDEHSHRYWRNLNPSPSFLFLIGLSAAWAIPNGGATMAQEVAQWL